LLQQSSKTEPNAVSESREVAEAFGLDLVVVAWPVHKPEDGAHHCQGDCDAKQEQGIGEEKSLLKDTKDYQCQWRTQKFSEGVLDTIVFLNLYFSDEYDLLELFFLQIYNFNFNPLMKFFN